MTDALTGGPDGSLSGHLIWEQGDDDASTGQMMTVVRVTYPDFGRCSKVRRYRQLGQGIAVRSSEAGATTRQS